MKKDKLFWQELKAEIENELKNIDKLAKELEKEKSLRAQGSILHDFYNCCERIFKKIAINIDGFSTSSLSWHKDLLYKMTISIKGVRKNVISSLLASYLDEYLSFRHIFRNVYGFELKEDRLKHLVDKFDAVRKRFKREIKVFLRKMDKG